MTKASVSVVIPCYNCANTIDRAINSIITQTLLPTEIILVDDASNDENRTRKKIMELQKSQPLGFIKTILINENSGAATARNKGWDVATGDYIAFLDSDDSWHPQKIEIQFAVMSENNEIKLTSHSYKIKKEVEKYELQKKHFSLLEITTSKMLLFNKIATRSVMLKNELPFRFEEGKRYSEDYHLWLKLIANSYNATHIPLILAYSYKEDYGDSGLSSHLWEMEKSEIKSILDIYSLGLLLRRDIAIAIPWSFVKFIRRYIITKLKFQ